MGLTINSLGLKFLHTGGWKAITPHISSECFNTFTCAQFSTLPVVKLPPPVADFQPPMVNFKPPVVGFKLPVVNVQPPLVDFQLHVVGFQPPGLVFLLIPTHFVNFYYPIPLWEAGPRPLERVRNSIQNMVNLSYCCWTGLWTFSNLVKVQGIINLSL